MLYNEHSKAGKELQRKIAKLREENKDPSLPQRVPSRSQSSTPAGAAVPAISSSVSAPPSAPSPPPHLSTRLSDSQQMVEESFMLLGQRVRRTHVRHNTGLNTSGAAIYRAKRTTRSITSGRSPKACSSTSPNPLPSPPPRSPLQRTARRHHGYARETATRISKIPLRKRSIEDWISLRPHARRCWCGTTRGRTPPIQTAEDRGSPRSHQNPSRTIGTTSLKQMVLFRNLRLHRAFCRCALKKLQTMT